MNEEDFSFLGLGLLGFFFGIYDEDKMQEGRAWLGKWVEEHGGVEQVWNENYKTLPLDKKEDIINTLEECRNIAIERGLISK